MYIYINIVVQRRVTFSWLRKGIPKVVYNPYLIASIFHGTQALKINSFFKGLKSTEIPKPTRLSIQLKKSRLPNCVIATDSDQYTPQLKEQIFQFTSQIPTVWTRTKQGTDSTEGSVGIYIWKKAGP